MSDEVSVLMTYGPVYVRCACQWQLRLDDPRVHEKVNDHRERHLEAQ